MRCRLIMQDAVQFAPIVRVGSGRAIPAYLTGRPLKSLPEICSVVS